MTTQPTTDASQMGFAAPADTVRGKMAWFEHNGSRIYYKDQGSGDLLLVLPGFTQSIEKLSALRGALVSAGYRVIAADLPGSGRSEPQPRAYPPTFYADDAHAFAALPQQLATGPAHLIGGSDGGEVALLMAAFTPGMARSVVTWGAAGALHEENRRFLELFSNVVDHPIEPMQGYSDELIATYGQANARAMTQSWVVAARAIMGSGGDISLS